jgi:DNA (cytosine-5)-methyltransferase 1
MKRQQILKLNEKQLRTIYNNIRATHNLVNIQTVCGKDLEIEDTDEYDYILTYSFPCQDLSLAGKGKGMSDTSTRSGMLWEVERILSELEEKPQILLMENVPQVHSQDNIEDFKKWIMRLEELGYKNYWQDLIATDYGIPQTRNRCFMVSILGDYSYSFPPKQELKLKLKDMLENNVDEKYYLSDKMINCFLSESKDSKFPRKERFLQTFNTTNEKGIAATITTCAGTRATDNFITNKSLRETLEQKEIKETCFIDTYNKRIDKEKSGTITTGVSFRNNTFLAIKNNNSKGYLEATDGDGIDISSRMKYHRGTVQKQKAHTITCGGGRDLGVVVNE